MIKFKNKKWFTLVELVIVLLIIWLLITILFPKYSWAVWQTNNLKRKMFVNKIAWAITIWVTQWKKII